ncbi:hypothetical protein KQ940_15445 [Marinobacterium sp. D7]|uniref:SMP-30/gluconolactonase/LRE family protein n=1 Tax=Marinobacterium ramblicola TaxID=2849041 RepID=UPI001C2D37FE|nr:hypothetical protein [Marinobacterium ramblicola]MBV1789449.1 hypothetical protein [Marinobacterium ramblicola]
MSVRKALLATPLALLISSMSHGQTLAATEAVTISGFMQPESAEPDPQNNYVYVSNIVGNPMEADGVGYISRVRPDGSELELKWVEGLDAPKGLALFDGRLYVADLHELVVIDVHEGRIVARYPAEQGQMLNGIDVAADGTVYLSDFLGNSIYRLEQGALELWLHDDKLGTPNGILADGDQLKVVTWGVGIQQDFSTDQPGHILNLSTKDGSFEPMPNGPAGNWDGVVQIGDSLVLSNWMTGELYQVQPDGSASRILQLEKGSADLGWDEDSNMLWVPEMWKDRLIGYRISR